MNDAVGTRTTTLISVGVAAFAAGAVAAVIASRLLPPILAQLTGKALAAAGRDPFEALIEDHRAIVPLLNQIDASPEHAVFDRAQLLPRLKRRLTAHAMAEESVVYPMFAERSKDKDHIRHLYREHAEMKMHLYMLEQMPKDSAEWLSRLHELKALIEAHARQEEESDFPKLRNRLNKRATALLSGNVQREKALVL